MVRIHAGEPIASQSTASNDCRAHLPRYSDEGVEKILNQAHNLNGGARAYAKHPRTFRLLLELMLKTEYALAM